MPHRFSFSSIFFQTQNRSKAPWFVGTLLLPTELGQSFVDAYCLAAAAGANKKSKIEI